MPWAFKLDHFQPLELILFRKNVQSFDFYTGECQSLHIYYPRGRKWELRPQGLQLQPSLTLLPLHVRYRCRVVENGASELSNPIFVMSARDRDDPPYNRIEYSLRDDLDGTFRINSTTGEIFAERPLDREMKAQYELEVRNPNSTWAFRI